MLQSSLDVDVGVIVYVHIEEAISLRNAGIKPRTWSRPGTGATKWWWIRSLPRCDGQVLLRIVVAQANGFGAKCQTTANGKNTRLVRY